MSESNTKTKKIDLFEKRIARGPNRLEQNLSRIVKGLGGKYGFAEVDLMTNWTTIVGNEFAAFLNPIKITFPRRERANGTLHVKMLNTAVATLITHQQHRIVERVNTYFGYAAVSKIVLK